jgi:hypothetical protein
MGASRWEIDSAKAEIALPDWRLGPQIGDRWRKYKSEFQALRHLSYKGSIRGRPCRGLSSHGGKESAKFHRFSQFC